MLDIVGIVLSLFLLMFLAYRGINVLVLAPLMASVAVLFSDRANLLGTYTQVFMTGLGDYLVKYFPLFLLGAIFGRLMDKSGSAYSIAHWIAEKIGKAQAPFAIVLACAILTYGGVSLFVVAFAVYPIAAALFREADIPKRLIPGAIALGSFTFTMTALPGSPQIQNAIPAPFFGTDAFAAPVLGTIGGLIMLVGGVAWLNWRVRQARGHDEGYGQHPGEESGEEGPRFAPSFWIALVPIVLVILFNYLFASYFIPWMDTSYLQQEAYGNASVDDVRGIWAIIAALIIAIVALIGINWMRFKQRKDTDLKESVNEGTMGSLLPIFNTASEVGYGSVIASLAGFMVIRDAVVGLYPNNPLISEAIAVNVLAGITGSASGGMSIALDTLGDTYLELAQQAGISPELLHRVAAMASGGFDALPHNGAVITLLAICSLSHRQSYFDIFMTAVAVPIVALVVVVTLGSLFGTF